MPITVKEPFRYTFSHGGWVDVPAGAHTQVIENDPGQRWVDPATFPGGSLERHDATHYGVRVPVSNTAWSA